MTLTQERGEAFVLKAMERLRASMTPSYQSLLQQIGRIDGGVKFLVDLRSDILVNIWYIFAITWNTLYSLTTVGSYHL